MNIVFFGTPDYVVPILESLHKTYNQGRERQLVAVVTQEPKPAGRTKELEYSAVDHFAHKHNIDIIFDLEDISESDLGVCAAYGKIIPKNTINKFKYGILNIHPSLLPMYRGASPTQAAILSGVEETGVTIIKMDEGMDSGDIVSSFKSEVKLNDTNESLRERLFAETIPFLEGLIPSYLKGKVNLKKQDDTKATFTKVVRREDGFIEPKFIENALTGKDLGQKIEVRFMNNQKFDPDTYFIERKFRAFTPWPGIYSTVKVKGKELRIKLLKVHVHSGRLVLDEVQLEGKNPVGYKQFKEGYPEAKFA